jgi:hypothetical protein
VMESKVRGVLEWARIDFSPTKRQPAWRQYAFAAALAIALSLGADVGLVHAGMALFPSTRGFSHFRFSDYATLTVIGVVIACAGWPLAIRVSSAPRWLYLRAAVAVTVVLWAPDLWLLAKGETGRGVAVLAVMHFAIAVITYNVLVRVAPPRGLGDLRADVSGPEIRDPRSFHERLRAWMIAMVAVISLEFVLGVIAIVAVPESRPTGWIPKNGKLVFALHGVVGIVALFGACVLVVLAHQAGKVARIASLGGLLGVALGGIGGLLAVDHGLRIAGMGVMFVASGISFFSYLVPLVEPARDEPPEAIQAPDGLSDAGDERALT